MRDLPPQTGGGYTFEADLLEALLRVRHGTAHTFVILCSADTADWIRRNDFGNVEIEVLPAEGWLRSLRESAIRCIQALRAVMGASALDLIARRRQLDFIWFAGSGTHFTNFPYLTVVWDLHHRSTPWFPEFSANGLWDRRNMSLWFLQRASAVVTGTGVGKAELREWVGVASDRILVLPHPTPEFALAAKPTTNKVISSSTVRRPYLFYPAQFWPHKNHVNLVLALGRVIREHHLDLDLILCGSDKGSKAHVQRCIAAERLQDRIHIKGYVPREELVDLYRNARALTYLSWGGPENLPPLEAFALGCPVIAACVPGAEEQLGGSALLVDPGDPVQIANAIVRLESSSQLRTELTERGMARAARWRGADYVDAVFRFLDGFEPIVRCWDRNVH